MRRGVRAYVEGRIYDADTVAATKNEIRTSPRKTDDLILALLEGVEADVRRVRDLRRPLWREPDFEMTSVDHGPGELVARAGEPCQSSPYR